MNNNKATKPKCYNCTFGGNTFKIAGKTHLHCENRELYPESELELGNISAWDTLREFSDKCDKHEFKPVNTQIPLTNEQQ